MSRALAILVLLTLPASALAQSRPRLSAGIGVTFFESTGKVRLTPAFRNHRTGFGPAIGLNWHTAEFMRLSNGFATRGDLRIRPLMVGLSYTRIRGRLATTAALVGGYSFNRISSMMPAAGAPVELRVEKSVAFAPVATLGLDLTRKLGLVANASYLVTRPQVTARSASLEDHRWRFRADTLVVQVGVVFGFF